MNRRSLAYGSSVEELDVVLIQDNRGSQAILRSMISSFRVKRLRVYDRADDALKDMMVDPPSVVVTDWRMRPVSGQRFTRLVRSSSMEPLCFVPIVVVTSGVTLSIIDKAFSAGVNTILVKPVAPAALRQRLDWLTRDGRPFVASGDGFVVEGIEEILETRVRRNDFAELMRRQRRMQDALARHAEDAQDLVDRIVNGEVEMEEVARSEGAQTRPGRKKVDTWHSWAMN